MSTTQRRGLGTATGAGVVVGGLVKAATAIVFQALVAGIASTVAIRGIDSTVIAVQATALNTDNIIFNAATVYVAALGGGEIYVEEAGYNLAATWNVSVYISVRGAGWNTILNYNAGGNCITFTGDNAKVRDLKIVITAGAGGGGTRPNSIFADTRTNIEVKGVWVVGDKTQADDGSDIRQCAVVFDTVNDSRILNNRFQGNDRHGVSLEASPDNAITGNTIHDNTQTGIFLNDSLHNSITGNIANHNGTRGIHLTGSTDNTITGNTCETNTHQGIRLETSTDNTLTGNTCTGNIRSGIIVLTSTDNTLTGNTCNENRRNGVFLDDASNNTLVGNTCNENDVNNTGTYSGITITDVSLDNLIHSNTCNDNDKYGIDIDDPLALRNWVKNNQLRGNTTGAFNDDVANLTKLATVRMQFVQGTTFISADASPKGWEIDAADEFAIALGQMPLEVQQVVRFKIWAVGLAAPGAGNAMMLEININAGGDDEVYTTEAIAVANKPSTTDNTAINDVIHWMIDATDDVDVDDIVGGDSVEVKVLHEVASGGDIATDATFRTVVVEVV